MKGIVRYTQVLVVVAFHAFCNGADSVRVAAQAQSAVADSTTKQTNKQEKQRVLDQFIKPLQDRIAEIDTRFAALQDPNSGVLYKSYKELLALLNHLYDTVEQVNKVQNTTTNPVVVQVVPTLQAQLAGQERSLLTYAHTLFQKEYPRRVTECQPLMRRWLTDIEGEDVPALEQKLAAREQTIATILGMYGKKELIMPNVQRAHKEFVMTPCWNKLKTKAQGGGQKPNGTVGRIVVQEGRNQEVYTEVP